MIISIVILYIEEVLSTKLRTGSGQNKPISYHKRKVLVPDTPNGRMGTAVVLRMGWNGMVSIARDQCSVPKFRACGALVVVSTALLSAGTLENGNGKWVFGRMGWNGFSHHSFVHGF
jgi:hypothetical protein